MTIDLGLLAARVAAGDDAAFRPIVEHTRGPLYRLAARLLGRLSDAEDVLQEAYVKAYRSMADGKYDGRAKVETWLYRIVANACVDALRKRAVRTMEAAEEHEQRAAKFDGLVKAEARIALGELEEMMKTLSADDRSVLVLVAVEGLTTKEVADTLGTTEGAIEQRLVRARARLRAERDDLLKKKKKP